MEILPDDVRDQLVVAGVSEDFDEDRQRFHAVDLAGGDGDLELHLGRAFAAELAKLLDLLVARAADVAEQPPTFSETEILYVQQALIVHCETHKDRFALLDPLPPEARALDPSRVLQWRQNFDSSYAALYYP